MLGLALQASETHAAASVAALQDARVTSREQERPALLQASARAQQDLIDTYDLLLTKMQEWEDFQEILELWRGLLEDQRQINRRYRETGEQR
jgi:hypothetical protein